MPTLAPTHRLHGHRSRTRPLSANRRPLASNADENGAGRIVRQPDGTVQRRGAGHGWSAHWTRPRRLRAQVPGRRSKHWERCILQAQCRPGGARRAAPRATSLRQRVRMVLLVTPREAPSFQCAFYVTVASQCVSSVLVPRTPSLPGVPPLDALDRRQRPLPGPGGMPALASHTEQATDPPPGPGFSNKRLSATCCAARAGSRRHVRRGARALESRQARCGHW